MEQDLQEIYTVFDYHFDRLENSLIDLEKGYYKLDAFYNDIEKEVEAAKEAVSQRGENRLLRKLYIFEEKLASARLKRGYDSLFFQKFFRLINEIRANSGTDLLSPAKKMQAQRFNNHNFYSFLMVENGSLHFLISCKHLHWQKKITRRKLKGRKIKMQIATLPQPNVFDFYFLKGEKQNVLSNSQKTAVLVERENGSTFFGFFCDALQGKIFLQKELFLKMQEKQELADSEIKNYIVLKGERYFIL